MSSVVHTILMLLVLWVLDILPEVSHSVFILQLVLATPGILRSASTIIEDGVALPNKELGVLTKLYVEGSRVL